MTAPAISIRKATERDAKDILSCLESAFEPFREDYTPEAFADTVLKPETICRRLLDMSVFVAIDLAGLVIGTVGCRVGADGEGHIRGMAVRPAFHGLGVAGLLLEAVESEMRAGGCSRIHLDTTEPLKRAIRFYEKRGFRPSGRVHAYFGMSLFEYVKLLE